MIKQNPEKILYALDNSWLYFGPYDGLGLNKLLLQIDYFKK